MDIKKALVEKLEKDCEIILNEKLKSALNNNNEGSYRNLVKALETNLELIEKHKCKDFIIDKLENVNFYNSNGDLMGCIPFMYNLTLIDNETTSKLECNYTGKTKINSLLNENGKSFIYKITAKCILKDLFNNNFCESEFVIYNAQISNNSIENSKITLDLLRLNDKPLYMFIISA